MFKSRFMPCPECGGSVDQSAAQAHRCHPERLADFQMFKLRDEVAALEHRLHAFLTSGSGQFEAWLAARQVRGQGSA